MSGLSDPRPVGALQPMAWPRMEHSHRALFQEVASHTRALLEEVRDPALIHRAEVVERFVGRGAAAWTIYRWLRFLLGDAPSKRARRRNAGPRRRAGELAKLVPAEVVAKGHNAVRGYVRQRRYELVGEANRLAAEGAIPAAHEHRPEPAIEAASSPIPCTFSTAPKEGPMNAINDHAASLPLFSSASALPAILSNAAAPAAMPFVFEGAEVRVVMRDGAPWFVLADVCRVLGIGNPSDAAKRLDEDERQVVDLSALDTVEGGKVGGLAAGMNTAGTIINESGLYSTVLTSRKEAARRFKKWVTGDVLPSIRKNGGYIAGQEKVATGEMTPAELVARGMLAAQSIIQEAEEARRLAVARAAELEGAVAEKDRVIVKQAETIVAQEPLVDAIERLRTMGGSLSMTEAAKALKIGPDAFIDMLKAEKWIYRRDQTEKDKRRNRLGAWLGHSRVIKSGMVEHRPVSAPRNGTDRVIRLQVVLTAAGLVFWAEKLGAREVPA